MTLEELYEERKATPWNLNEHMDTLRGYAAECNIVTEFGTHKGFSTIAFLAGVPKELHCWDIIRQPEVDTIEALAAETPTRFVFHHGNSLHADFTTTDLLFIDSLHQYDQVIQELQNHAHKATKYLIFHDTIAWGYIDEVPSNNPTDINYGWAHKKGVAQAIGHYMVDHPEWKIFEQYYHNCGLVVYRKM
jgi:predicted O-methyltransferase YrrM